MYCKGVYIMVPLDTMVPRPWICGLVGTLRPHVKSRRVRYLWESYLSMHA